MSNQTCPENRLLAATHYSPAVRRRLIEAICVRHPGLADRDVTFRHLALMREDEIIGALRGPGIRRAAIESVIWDRRETVDWLRPIGSRVPMPAEEMVDYREDAELEQAHQEWFEQPVLGVLMAPAWLKSLRTTLADSTHPEATTIAKGLADAFERADNEYAQYLDLTPRPPVEWTEREGAYYLRVAGKYNPMLPVRKQWDAVVGVFSVSIVRVSKHPGAGAYYGFLDLDDRAERIVCDQSTFPECERDLLDQLALRFPIVSQPIVDLHHLVSGSRKLL